MCHMQRGTLYVKPPCLATGGHCEKSNKAGVGLRVEAERENSCQTDKNESSISRVLRDGAQSRVGVGTVAWTDCILTQGVKQGC